MASLTELLDIQQAAVRMLKPLVHATPAALLAALQPRDEDYDAVFLPDAAARARAGYASLWASPPPGLGKPDQSEVEAIATHAEALSGDTALPNGYKRISQLLKPGVVWLAFKVRAPTASAGMAYDGLVWLDGRWAWFPKPWRVIAEPEGSAS
ncbi:MAG: hypothetical protein NT062_17370 [Proteobacteria bacterium]|nr:hypothetical protein [Pseudomonadota bacterium]